MLSRFIRKIVLRKIVSRQIIPRESSRNIAICKGVQLADSKRPKFGPDNKKDPEEWPEITDPFSENNDFPLPSPSSSWISTLFSNIFGFVSTTWLGAALEFFTRMLRRFTYGDQISQAEHNKVCKDLKLQIDNLKKSHKVNIYELRTNYKAEIKSQQLRIGQLKFLMQRKDAQILKLKKKRRRSLLPTERKVKKKGKFQKSHPQKQGKYLRK